MKVTYEQVRPHKTSHLHEAQTVDSSATASLDDAIALQAKGFPQNNGSEQKKKEHRTTKRTADVIVMSQTKAKKRKIGHMAISKYALLKK